MCVSVSSQREFVSLWHELQKDRPELLSVLEGILIHAVSQLQDCIRERDSLEQALRRFCLPPSCPPHPHDDMPEFCSALFIYPCVLFQAGKRTRPDRSVHLRRRGKPDSGGERETFDAGLDVCYFHRFCHGPKMSIFMSFEQFIVKLRKA